MAKFRPMARPTGNPSMGGGMMKQIQKLQEEMVKTQEALAQETLTVTAGGGAVTIIITGNQRIQSIALKPEIVQAEDIEMLQDLIVAAVNEAIEASQALAAKRLEPLTGGLSITGL